MDTCYRAGAAFARAASTCTTWRGICLRDGNASNTRVEVDMKQSMFNLDGPLLVRPRRIRGAFIGYICIGFVAGSRRFALPRQCPIFPTEVEASVAAARWRSVAARRARGSA